MSNVTPAAIKALREKTGAGMMECKAALTEAEGSEEKAIEILRKRGLATDRGLFAGIEPDRALNVPDPSRAPQAGAQS